MSRRSDAPHKIHEITPNLYFVLSQFMSKWIVNISEIFIKPEYKNELIGQFMQRAKWNLYSGSWKLCNWVEKTPHFCSQSENEVNRNHYIENLFHKIYSTNSNNKHRHKKRNITEHFQIFGNRLIIKPVKLLLAVPPLDPWTENMRKHVASLNGKD